MPTEKNRETSAKKGLDHDPVKLRRKRYEAGLNQKSLAEAAGMAPTSVCELEKGRRNPSPRTLARLADALGCRPVDLMSDVPQSEPV